MNRTATEFLRKIFRALYLSGAIGRRPCAEEKPNVVDLVRPWICLWLRSVDPTCFPCICLWKLCLSDAGEGLETQGMPNVPRRSSMPETNSTILEIPF